jgi:hypothetical protein
MIGRRSFLLGQCTGGFIDRLPCTIIIGALTSSFGLLSFVCAVYQKIWNVTWGWVKGWDVVAVTVGDLALRIFAFEISPRQTQVNIERTRMKEWEEGRRGLYC